jgi:hypothetical protein
MTLLARPDTNSRNSVPYDNKYIKIIHTELLRMRGLRFSLARLYILNTKGFKTIRFNTCGLLSMRGVDLIYKDFRECAA